MRELEVVLLKIAQQREETARLRVDAKEVEHLCAIAIEAMDSRLEVIELKAENRALERAL